MGSDFNQVQPSGLFSSQLPDTNQQQGDLSAFISQLESALGGVDCQQQPTSDANLTNHQVWDKAAKQDIPGMNKVASDYSAGNASGAVDDVLKEVNAGRLSQQDGARLVSYLNSASQINRQATAGSINCQQKSQLDQALGSQTGVAQSGYSSNAGLTDHQIWDKAALQDVGGMKIVAQDYAAGNYQKAQADVASEVGAGRLSQQDGARLINYIGAGAQEKQQVQSGALTEAQGQQIASLIGDTPR